jgi:hypothetical protein
MADVYRAWRVLVMIAVRPGAGRRDDRRRPSFHIDRLLTSPDGLSAA